MYFSKTASKMRAFYKIVSGPDKDTNQNTCSVLTAGKEKFII